MGKQLVFNNIKYTCLYKGKKGPFSNFIIEKEYYRIARNGNLKGLERAKALKKYYLLESHLNGHLAELGDIVNIQLRKRTVNSNGIFKLCKQIKSWVYSGETYKTTAIHPVITPPNENTQVTLGEPDCLYLTDKGREIYDMAKKRVNDLSGDLIWDMSVVEDVVEVLSELKPGVTEALTNLGMLELYGTEMTAWTQEVDLGYYYYTNKQLTEYRDYLVSFSRWFAKNRERFQTENDVDKLYWMVYYFDKRVLRAIPYQEKIKVLDKFLTENIDERFITSLSVLREPLVLKLFRTINDDEASDFLEALLEKPKKVLPDGTETLLDVYDKSIRLRALYKAIDDKRFTIFGNDNRKAFVELIVKLWKKSKYSFYDPTLPNDNDQNFDSTSYFNNEGLRYFIDDGNPYWYIKNEEIEHLGEPVIEIGDFGTWYNEQNELVSVGDFSFNFSLKYTSGKDEDFKEEIITIHQNKGYTPVYGNTVFDFVEVGPKFFGDNNHDLKYHVYQPIKFIQFEDSGERILSMETIPALSFYYEQEYEEIKKLDAAIVLAAEISLEALFFAISGGASSLAQIRHLRYVTKLGRGLTATGNAVKVWRGAEVALEALSFTSGVLSSSFNYLASTADVNSLEYEKYKDMRMFFGLLALTTGVGAAGARTLATKKAVKLVNKMDVEGVVYNMDPELEHIIRTIGNSDIFIQQMRSNLTFLESSQGFINLVNRFDELPQLKKYDFYQDFNDLKDINSWRLFNNSPEAFNNWKALKNLDSPDTKLLSVITNQNRTNGYIRYYNEDVSKAILSRNYSQTERIAFIDEFGDVEDAIFLNFNNNPYAIELGMQGIFPIANSKDILKLDEIKDVLRTTFANNEFDIIGLKATLNSIPWNTVEPNFLNVIDDFIPMSSAQLASFRSEYTQYFTNASASVRSSFSEANRARVTTKIYQDNQLQEEVIELFISGSKNEVDPVLEVLPPNIRNKFVEPLNEEQFLDVFNKASIDATNDIARFHDTEVKYVYNFLLNHIGSGNKFIIEIESLLYTCPNCQKYFIGLKKYAETQNIEIQIISRAHPKALQHGHINKIVNQ